MGVIRLCPGRYLRSADRQLFSESMKPQSGAGLRFETRTPSDAKRGPRWAPSYYSDITVLPFANFRQTRTSFSHQRRRSESNRRIADLQSAALPLGHGAEP